MFIVMSEAKYDSLTIAEKESSVHQNNDNVDQREVPGKSSNKVEFTDEEDSISCESTGEEEEDIAENNTDKHDSLWQQDKTDEKSCKSNLRFVIFCILAIMIAFPLFGLAMYLVQEGRKVVKC